MFRVKNVARLLCRLGVWLAVAIVFAGGGYGQEAGGGTPLTIHVGQSRMIRLAKPVGSVFVAESGDRRRAGRLVAGAVRVRQGRRPDFGGGAWERRRLGGTMEGDGGAGHGTGPVGSVGRRGPAERRGPPKAPGGRSQRRGGVGGSGGPGVAVGQGGPAGEDFGDQQDLRDKRAAGEPGGADRRSAAQCERVPRHQLGSVQPT